MPALSDLAPRRLDTPRMVLHRFDASFPPHPAFFLRELNRPEIIASIGDRGYRKPEDVLQRMRQRRPRAASFALPDLDVDCECVWIARMRGDDEDADKPPPDDIDAYVGMLTVVQWADNHMPDIGWQITPAMWGRGLAAEGARAVFEAVSAPPLSINGPVAVILAGNTRSEAVVRKLGFVRAGRAVEDDGREMGLYAPPGVKVPDEVIFRNPPAKEP